MFTLLLCVLLALQALFDKNIVVFAVTTDL